jgi:hypothetical protein
VGFTAFPCFVQAGSDPNLVPNPQFANIVRDTGLPHGWQRSALKIPGLEASSLFICQVSGHPGRFLALQGGQDRRGRVWCQIDKIHPHTDYLLEFSAYRPEFKNRVYLEVEIFGQTHLINQHFTYGRVQQIFLPVNSGYTNGTTRLVMANPHQEVLAFGTPSLRALRSQVTGGIADAPVRLPNFFPVGIYHASPEALPEIQAAGFNTVQSCDADPDHLKRMAAICNRLGLKFLPTFCSYQPEMSRELGGRPEILGFYIADEPEGRGVRPEKIQSLKTSLQQDHAKVLTAMAILRPQMTSLYRQASDIFLLDPYPVPNMPMTWLADVFEEAGKYVPRERLWAVIQAFGGEKWRKDGWPRRPTYLEMRCLTYLALAHGAHGLFYFSYPEAKEDPAAWESLTSIVKEFRQLRSWLLLPNAPTKLQIEMTSPFKADAAGNPAVHFCQKQRQGEHLLVLVNVIDQPVSCLIRGFPPDLPWVKEIFQQKRSVILDGNIREELGPHEVRLYRYP